MTTTGTTVDNAAIPGWGVDADGDNNPTWPMRHVEDQTRGLEWTRPAVQVPQVEILRSIEHDRQPAVVGTSVPPSGLSGAIRRHAFRRSESDWWHWLLLMGADRINVVEGVVDDLRRGNVPNVPAEMGIAAEWRHNRRGLATKAATIAGLTAIGVLLLRRRRPSRVARVADRAPALPLPEPDERTGSGRTQSSVRAT